MHCAKHLDALLYALHISASAGDRSATKSYTYSDSNRYSHFYTNTDCDSHAYAHEYSNANSRSNSDAKPSGRLHGAEFHGRQDEPGAIRLERRRFYPAEHYHDDTFKWSPD
jgi:hypothetical protein